MSDKPFYADGLRFACTRCSACCRHTPGYVFLSDKDVDALTARLGIERPEFFRRYTRRVRFGPVTRISLREKPNVDCIFWDNGGCSVYDARPLQCRAFPFWSSCVSSAEEWEFHSGQCPGMGQGELHDRKTIEKWLALREEEGLIEA